MDGYSFIVIIIIIQFKAVLFHTTKHDLKRPEYEGPFIMDYREGRSHAWGVYIPQYTSRMGTARVKREEEAHTGIVQESSKKSERKERPK